MLANQTVYTTDGILKVESTPTKYVNLQVETDNSLTLNEIEKDLPGFSLEHYDLLKKVGSEAVLSEISKQIRTVVLQ